MPRVKRGVTAHKKRERLLKKSKGYRWDRKSKERAAKEALLHGLSRKFKGRKEKKRVYRTLWQTQINAGSRLNGVKYSEFINLLKKENIKLDRKVLADLAANEPEAFKKLVDSVKKI
ncbi:50S ribosomal protein L20 [Patescibacteria group bacterium]|nr:50S ribosomal protein L20 [Patescibacteria group bacterium]